MSTDTPNILIIGASRRVVDDAVEQLRQRGLAAVATTDVEDLPDQADPKLLDVVIFGRRVPPKQRAEIQAEFEAANPSVKVVSGLGGIPGLIADLAEAALAEEHATAGEAPIYDPDRRAIVLRIDTPLDVRITVYWTTEMIPPDPKSDSRLLTDDHLPAGEHVFALPDGINMDAAYATVRAGGASWSFRLSR